MNWQPIDTAPKDGTVVDLWFPKHPNKEKESQGHRVPDCKWSTSVYKWVMNEINADVQRLMNCWPTHWMPLPPPPSDEEDTFTAHGLTWRKHTPGDPMPCDENAMVRVLLREDLGEGYHVHFHMASLFSWRAIPILSDVEIIGWNYAD